VIELRGVGMRLQGRTVLRHVDLDVAPGECCALHGGSGSGKSTLLRICAALLRPHAGSVVVAGCDAMHDARAVRGRIGYVPQSAGRVDGQTVAGEIDLAAACHGIAGERRRRIIADLLELTSLDAVAERDVAAVSPGQHRRLLLACALVHDPAVLVLDTPDAALDDDGVADLAALLGELRDMGKSLLVTGTTALLAKACDSEAMLDAGVITRPHRAARVLPA
jgi:ABC-2 type transport system ATP-binding protein